MDTDIEEAVLSKEFDACRQAIEAGQTVWLVERGGVRAGRVRSLVDSDGAAVYELVIGAGYAEPIANPAYGGSGVPAREYTDVRCFLNMDALMNEILERHDGWTLIKEDIGVNLRFHWWVDGWDPLQSGCHSFASPAK